MQAGEQRLVVGERRPRRARLLGLSLGALGCLLAVVTLDSRSGPKLAPLHPWGAAFAGAPVVRAESNARLDGSIDIGPNELPRFVSGSQELLLHVADHLNRLRRIAATERTLAGPPSRIAADRFQTALQELERYSMRATVSGVAPLCAPKPLRLLDSARRLCLVNLSGYADLSARLPEQPLADAATLERTLMLLDQAYYRLVTAYRELGDMLPAP